MQSSDHPFESASWNGWDSHANHALGVGERVPSVTTKGAGQFTVYCCRTVQDCAHSGVSLPKAVGRSLGLYRVSADGILFLPLPPCEVGKVYPHLGPMPANSMGISRFIGTKSTSDLAST